jgi:hypothetical protein
VVNAPHSGQKAITIRNGCEDGLGAVLLGSRCAPAPIAYPPSLISTQHKFQKCFADDNFIAVMQGLFVARQQTRAAIDKRPIGTAQVFNQILTILTVNPRVTARDLRLWIILIKINIRKDATISIPTPDHCLCANQREFFADLPAALNDQARAGCGGVVIQRLITTHVLRPTVAAVCPAVQSTARTIEIVSRQVVGRPVVDGRLRRIRRYARDRTGRRLITGRCGRRR